MNQISGNKKKLIASLHGGAGNQLFQYAYARALSLRLNRHLIFDQYGFRFDKKFKRSFILDSFDLPKGVCNEVCGFRFQIARALRRFNLFGCLLISFFRLPFLIEFPPINGSKNLTNDFSEELYVFGYWQDENYFEEYSDQIRKDLTFKSNFSKANLVVATEIKGCSTPISIHVRRLHQVGASEKQVPKPQNRSYYYSVGHDYYTKAITFLEEKFPDAKFFVFSDFPEWARQNVFSNNSIFYLESGRGSDLEDLSLMSLCKHHVIANSSFSWWGAWLAEPKDHIVIAPKSAPLMPKIPARWLTIDL